MHSYDFVAIYLPVNTDKLSAGWGGGGLLPYMGYIGMCRCEGCGFQVVYCGIG